MLFITNKQSWRLPGANQYLNNDVASLCNDGIKSRTKESYFNNKYNEPGARGIKNTCRGMVKTCAGASCATHILRRPIATTLTSGA